MLGEFPGRELLYYNYAFCTNSVAKLNPNQQDREDELMPEIM